MTMTRKKTVNVVYNGIEVWKSLDPYLESFSYFDSVDESDKISFSVNDRDLKWVNSWMPQTGDVIQPSVILENWNYEGEKMTVACGDFVVDDFSFSSPPLSGSINGVSAPVNTSFKETMNTRTWEAATISLIASEIASKYGLTSIYDAPEIQVVKTEQSNQADSDFIKSLCQKYGLGMKVYANRLVIWDYKTYFKKRPVIVLTPQMVSKWSYRKSMQGTYTGAKVSYTNPATKKMVEVIVGTPERLYRTTQKADNEADARLIGEGAVLNANRKAETMQITLSPKLSIMACMTVQLSEFGKMDGIYFVEQVSHTIGRKSYTMQLKLSRITENGESGNGETAGSNASTAGAESYVIKKGDTLWDLAKKKYGNGSKYTLIYEANKDAIEADAKKHGKSSSNNGYWIYPGLTITIPA